MAIDDKLEKALDQLASSARVDVGKEVIRLAASLFPVGRALDRLMNGVAQRRLIERIVEVFEEVKLQLDGAGEATIEKEYFLTEEFQTLLTLVLQEIQTTHDRTKLQMLASALSNSCQTKFQSETRKELFVRTLRSLSPNHICALDSLVPTHVTHDEFNRLESRFSLGEFVTEEGTTLANFSFSAYSAFINAFPLKAYPLVRSPRGEQLLLLQNLASNGLVEEMLGPRVREPSFLPKGRTKYKTASVADPETPARCFKLSTFGEDFLAFVSRRTI